jgi:hypothetical protein
VNELQTVPGISVSLVPERIGQLSANLGRERLIVHSAVVGESVFRHPEGSKKDIPDRKRPGSWDSGPWPLS